MRLIGLTGGIGTGKSTVAGMLRALGVTVIDADEGARAVVEPGTPGLAAVVREFGPEVAPHGRLDREALAAVVFADPERRAALNAITHPAVADWMAQRTLEADARGEEIVVHDIPLLYENRRQPMFERVIVVFAPAALAEQRLVEKGYTVEQARARIAAQMPIEEKVAMADAVIDNTGSLEATRRQVAATWAELAAV